MRQQVQHCGVQRIVQVRDIRVGAIGGQQVLDQVVGADGQEIQFLGEHVQRQRGGGNLDHAADLHPAVVGDAFVVQALFGGGDELQGLVEFRHAGQHRHQDFYVAVMRGAQQ